MSTGSPDRRGDLISFEYCVIRYTQDPAGGEALNIGVLLYAPSLRRLGCRTSGFTRRLSDAFAEFDSYQYRRVTAALERGVEAWNSLHADPQGRALDLRPDAPPSLSAVARSLWSDLGGSYFFDDAAGAIGTDVAEELDALYFRFVESQYADPRRPKRNDEDVWNVYANALRRIDLTATIHLQPKTFEVDAFEIPFQRTFKNGVYSALQPVSLDYADKNSIRGRVERLLGEDHLLSGRADLAKIYVLLGKPSDPNHTAAYRSAITILKRMSSKNEVFEEDEADAFAGRLVDTMRRYGVIGEGADAGK